MPKVQTSFSADFIEKIKALLTGQKIALEKDLEKFAKKDDKAVEEDYDAKFPNYGDTEDDNAREVADYEANLSIEDGLDKTLRDVNSSLSRIAKGTYGTCKYCKKLIDEKRLLARPTSSACVECKKTIKQEV